MNAHAATHYCEQLQFLVHWDHGVRLHALMKANKRMRKMRERVFLASFCAQKITTIREAILSLEDVAAFIEDKGCTSEATQVCRIRDLAAACTQLL